MAVYYKNMKNNISKLKLLNSSNAFIIHYACNGLYNGTSPAPSISCIIVCNITCKNKRRFCINDYLGEYNMKDAEKILLQNFANFINQNTDKYFVHWNMNSQQYGFGAIKTRCNEFGIEINSIPAKNKIDLSQIVEVIAKEKLTLRQVLFFNDIPFEDFLNGKEELKAFYDRNFGKILESVHNKVIGLSMIIEDINKNSQTTFQSNFINQIATNDLTTSNYNNIETDTKSEIFIFDSAHPILSWVASLLINR